MWLVVAYLVAGVINDVLATLYCGFVVDGKALYTGLSAAGVTVFNCTVIYFLVLNPNALLNILAYSTGCGLGAGLIVWNRREKI
jgi:hypothetical protein